MNSAADTDAEPVRPVISGRMMMVVPAVLAGLSMIGPFAIDMPFPAFQVMGEQLRANEGQMQLVVSAYMIPFGLMSPFWGPLSDAVGRRPVIFFGVFAFALASIGCAFSPNLTTLLIFRSLQGFSAGGGVIVSRTVIRDVFEGAQAQRLMSRVMMIFGLAPAIAPIVAGGLLQVGPWPLIFAAMAGLSLGLIGIAWFALPETHPPARRKPLRVSVLLGSLWAVTRRLAFHRVAWAAALGFAGQFIYIGAAPILVVDIMGKGELDFWMLFVPMIGGVMLGSFISGRSAGIIPGRTLVTAAGIFAIFAVVVNIVLASLPVATQMPYAVAGPTLLAISTSMSYPTYQLILLDMFPEARGASVSMFTFITLLLNGLFAAVLTPHVTDSMRHLALASGAITVLGCFVWILHLRVSRYRFD